MDPFSYIVTFVALIPALALTWLLGGTADLVQHGLSKTPGRVTWSGLFIIAVVGAVFGIAFQWWIIYIWHDQGPYNFTTFAFLLVRPAVLLFIARLLIPDIEPNADVDLDGHYFAVIRWAAPLTAVYILLDLPDPLLHGPERFAELGGVWYAVFVVAWAALYGSLGVVRSRRYHWIIASVLWGVFALSQVAFGTGVLE